MLLDSYRIARQLEHVRILERKTVAVGLRDFLHPRRAPRGVSVGKDDLLPLGTKPASNDRRTPLLEHRFMNVELVRVHRALNHQFAQAVGTGDEDDPGKTRLGIEREHDPACGEVAAHHLLDCGREGHLGLGKAMMHPVRDGPVVVQGGEDLPDRVEHVVDPADVEEGLLLARE